MKSSHLSSADQVPNILMTQEHALDIPWEGWCDFSQALHRVQWFSKWDPQTSSIRTTWELV